MFSSLSGPFGPTLGAANSAGGGAAPVITSPSFLVTGTENTVYPTTTFTATGTAPITWSIFSGTLPAGMTFVGGVLAGTPTATSSGSITFTATNALGSDSRALTLTVGAAGGFASPVNTIPPTIETVISGATINQVGTMLRVKRGGWPATDGWTLDWRDPNAAYANPGITIINGSTANPVNFALSRRYQWLRDGLPIPGQNGIVYTLSNQDVGKTVSVREIVNRVVPDVTNTSFVESSTKVSVNSSTSIQVVANPSLPSSLTISNDIAYIGSFKLRNPYYDGGPAPYAINNSSGIAFDPLGDGGLGSIFVINEGCTAEYKTYTALGNAFALPYTSLPETAIIQNAKDLISDWVGTIPFPTYSYGVLIDGANIIQSVGNLYSNQAPNLTHVKRTKNIATSVISGVPSLVVPSGGYGNGRFLSGPMCHIPTAWQSALGGKALTGWAGTSVNSNVTKGPPAYAFDPANIGSANVTAQTLLYYANATPLDSESQNGGNDAKGSQAPLWTSMSFSYGRFGMVIPNGTNSLLYFGPHAVGLQGYSGTTGYEVDNLDSFYGGGTRNSFDSNQTSRGPYANSYVMQCWAYNLQDLADVKSGTKIPYNVKPYGAWSIPVPISTVSSSDSNIARPRDFAIVGAAWDSVKNKLYIAHNTPTSSELIISVYNVANAT
jgi:hypothetical protein